MRIVAGAFRGRRLNTPKGLKTRPTSDRVREAIFNIIAPHLAGARVLDLFAGTGAMGLEALSRGAESAVFVDESSDAVRLIRSNVTLCGVEDRTRIVQGSVEQALKRICSAGDLFDVIFLDPPYGKGYVEKALPHAAAAARLEALAVAEHHVKDVLPESAGGWARFRERRYGDTVISFFSRIFPADEQDIILN